jgi:hypothetical protein
MTHGSVFCGKRAEELNMEGKKTADGAQKKKRKSPKNKKNTREKLKQTPANGRAN